MKGSARILVVLLFCGLLWGQTTSGPSLGGRGDEASGVQFRSLDIYLDTGSTPLAAWQFELKAQGAEVKLVGVEAGDHPAFAAEPPYCDNRANVNDRIVIAAFSTEPSLPTGRTRVARLHLRIAGGGEPLFTVKVDVAATVDGKSISAAASIQ